MSKLKFNDEKFGYQNKLLKSCQTTKNKYDYTVRKHWASTIELKCAHGTLKPSSENILSENIR